MTGARRILVAGHALVAALLLYVGVRSLPLVLMSAMVFDAPGSETMVSAWLIFAAMIAAPFVEIVLALLLVALAVKTRSAPRGRPRAFALVVYALVVLAIGGTLATPLRALVF